MKYFSSIPIIGIIRGADKAAVHEAVDAALHGGLRTLEITLNSPDACEQIAAVKTRFSIDIELGAGTVLDAESAERALDAQYKSQANVIKHPTPRTRTLLNTCIVSILVSTADCVATTRWQ